MESGWADLNRRPLAPQASTLNQLRYSPIRPPESITRAGTLSTAAFRPGTRPGCTRLPPGRSRDAPDCTINRLGLPSRCDEDLPGGSPTRAALDAVLPRVAVRRPAAARP